MVFVSKRENPETLVHQLGVSTESHNLKFHEVTSWLDTELNALSHSNYIVIILPLYCKQVGPPRKFLAKYSIHQSLRTHCSAIITSYEGHVLKRIDFKDASLLQNGFQNQELNTIAIPLIDRILPGSSVQIEVRHDILGQLCANRVTPNEMLEGKNQEDKPMIQRDASLSDTKRHKVFIVHGHDDASKYELASFLWQIGLEPIILHEHPNASRTIIEKFERFAADVRYAFVLLTPDDFGGDKMSAKVVAHPRARQNVILEMGYFMGRLNRDRVCCLAKGEVETPSDMYGISLLKYNQKVEEKFHGIRQELVKAGYTLKQ